MNNSQRFTLRISTVCFGVVLGALVIMSLVGVAHTVRAQSLATEKVIYNFAPATGDIPTGVVSDPSGNLYVATKEGGSNQSCNEGCGNILKLIPPGQAKQLYAFPPGVGNQAPEPFGALTRDAAGNLYGVTGAGGRYNSGSVFKLTPSGVEGILYSFDRYSQTEGDAPSSGVTIDSEGNLYGATSYGGGTGCDGYGCGIIYRLTPSGSETARIPRTAPF
jgi:uncharacterized repeat protein (TIGR03803 family)